MITQGLLYVECNMTLYNTIKYNNTIKNAIMSIFTIYSPLPPMNAKAEWSTSNERPMSTNNLYYHCITSICNVPANKLFFIYNDLIF